jgi:hypothetical protein
MTSTGPDPYSNTCIVILELPWEVAEAFAKFGPAWVQAVQQAVATRSEHLEAKADARKRLDASAEANKTEWAALAAYCEREIARRSNGPGQRGRIVKQLASERKVSAAFIESVCRVYRLSERQVSADLRKAEVIRLFLIGRTDAEIAREANVPVRTVARIIAEERPSLPMFRGASGEFERLRQAAGLNGPGGAK